MSGLTSKDKKRLFSIFENSSEDDLPKFQKTRDSDVLIIDGNNTFVRSFMANPSLNDDGEHVGGIDGFLKSIGYAIRMIRPTRCIVVFDGKGGSKRRKAIYSEYKGKRKTRLRMNRIYEDMSTPDLEEKSVLEQMQKCVVLCSQLPLTLMAIDNIEADDTIAFLCTEVFNTDATSSITIMSTDQDFYQLVNDKIRVYSPTKKRIYNKQSIFDEFGVTSQNYIYYKILNGDKSDNIDGVKGIGLSTAKKALPMICEDKQVTLDEIFKYVDDNYNGKLKAYKTISSEKSLVERNYKLMQLNKSDISTFAKTRIQDTLTKPVAPTNVYKFTEIMKKYKLFAVFNNHHVWLKETFGILDVFVKQN